ncbi:MAG: nucleoside deaminase [Actinobacteria bacterium]|nr:nucleoside deaminase [Actinomycetota bacterium]
MSAAWSVVLDSAWTAFCAGTLPIGAAVLDAEGRVVSIGRNRRREARSSVDAVAETRIAHAELMALAQLPVTGKYQSFSLFSNVEPCLMCFGAALQTGVGDVHYAWPDAYAGATSVHLPTPQQLRWPITVHVGPGEVALVTAALVACHYVVVRREKPRHTQHWVEADPAFFTRVDQDGVSDFVALRSAESAPSADVMPELLRRLSDAHVERATDHRRG